MSDVMHLYRNPMRQYLIRLVALLATVSTVSLNALATPSKSANSASAAVSAAMSVQYVPANPSTVPDMWKPWESSANDIIKVVGVAAHQKTNAADIYYESTRAGLEVTTVFVLVELLSRFDESTVSSTGSIGLFQISRTMHGRLGNPANTLYQGKYNLRLGCSLLRLYLDQEAGNMGRAIARFFREAAPQSNPEARMSEFMKLYGTRSSKLIEPH